MFLNSIFLCSVIFGFIFIYLSNKGYLGKYLHLNYNDISKKIVLFNLLFILLLVVIIIVIGNENIIKNIEILNTWMSENGKDVIINNTV